MKLGAGAFIAGAASRLLPPSIPFRFFGAAVVYHLLAWIALFAGAQGVPRFAGGLGWPLAALHLLTLGVLAMTAIGASLQLLPVATRQPVRSKRWPAMIWWLYTPGVAAVALGMGMPAPRLLAGGAVAVVAALGGYALLLARNLIGARGMPVVVAHGWAALGSLVVVLATALSLACAYLGFPGFERGMALSLHVAFAAYGFMGLLALGLSYILVPMFALSAAPDERRAWMSLTLAMTALLLSAAASSGIAQQPLRMAAIGAGTRRGRVAFAIDERRAQDRHAAGAGTFVHAGSDRMGLARRQPGRGSRRRNGRACRRYGYAVRDSADRRLAAHLPCRHPAADHAISRLDARRPRQKAAADAILVDRAASTLDPFRLPSRGVGVACIGSRNRQRASRICRRH